MKVYGNVDHIWKWLQVILDWLFSDQYHLVHLCLLGLRVLTRANWCVNLFLGEDLRLDFGILWGPKGSSNPLRLSWN